TLVYINAGRELAKIESAKDIASPTLIFSFVLLSIFPLVIRKVLTHLRKRREQGSGNGRL
ncbi:MAG TPA: hypothetical protein VK445_04775, partial [Dissulfurispiraceae bacterium]|nr:hypothetical protein [Dissulfurispiraceae bacterium]